MNTAQIYSHATNPKPLNSEVDPAIEQAAIEKRIWLSSSKTKEVSFKLHIHMQTNLDQAMNLACQALLENDAKIRSLLQQAAVLKSVNNILEGKTDKYE